MDSPFGPGAPNACVAWGCAMKLHGCGLTTQTQSPECACELFPLRPCATMVCEMWSVKCARVFVAAVCVSGLWPWRCFVFVVSECDLCGAHVCVRCGDGRVMYMWFDERGMHVGHSSLNKSTHV